MKICWLLRRWIVSMSWTLLWERKGNNNNNNTIQSKCELGVRTQKCNNKNKCFNDGIFVFKFGSIFFLHWLSKYVYLCDEMRKFLCIHNVPLYLIAFWLVYLFSKTLWMLIDLRSNQFLPSIIPNLFSFCLDINLFIYCVFTCICTILNEFIKRRDKCSSLHFHSFQRYLKNEYCMIMNLKYTRIPFDLTIFYFCIILSIQLLFYDRVTLPDTICWNNDLI